MTPAGAGAPERVGEQVYQILRERILTGRLAPGGRLSVPAISRELGVSRSPVREAVLRLGRDGLVREEFNRGAAVPSFDAAHLVSLYEAREALEGMAARLAVAHFDASTRRDMLAVLTEHQEVVHSGDAERHIELDGEFHRLVRQCARSPVLGAMLEQIQDQVVVAMRWTSVTGGVGPAVDDHRAVFAALASGDPDRAETAARRHIARLTDLLRKKATS